MALIDSYRNSKLNKQNDRAKLVADKAKEHLKVAVLSKRAGSARDAMKRTKTVSTINSKIKEIDKCESDTAIIMKKIADLEAKIVSKEKEIVSYQIKIDKEQAAMDQKKLNTETKFKKDQGKSMRSIDKTLNIHNALHQQTQTEIRALKDIPKKITVLFLASNPLDLTPLRLDEEARAIASMIRQSRYSDAVHFE